MKQIHSPLAHLGLAAALFISAAGAALAQKNGSALPTEHGSTINYHVTPSIGAETFEVGATLNNVAGDTITFHFPIWGPGAYDIVNFGAYVHDFTATNAAGRKLQVVRGDTNTFRIIGGDAKVNIAYKVADIEKTPASLWFGLSDIESDFVFANTPAIFGYPEGYKDIPYSVVYNVPRGWDIAIGLDPAPGKNTYAAHDYDELVDAPVTMGKFQRLEFTAGGKPHIIAVFASEPLSTKDANDLVATTKRVVEMMSGFFGDMPYDRYVFQHFLVRPGMGDALFGALEHRNSSTYRMPLYGGSAAELLRAVIAHEYWHLWSPKRIHVRELGPFDYQRAPHTNSLWFAEGLTEYYAQVLLARNNMSEPRAMLGTLNGAMQSFYGKRQGQSIGDLSLRISEVEPADALSLYSKGPMLGLFLDAAIRTQTNNAKSLDDAMRYFNEEYGKKGKSFGDDEIIPIIERATGAKLSDFYNRYILGHDPLPFDEYLPGLGLKVKTTYVEKKTLGAEVEMTDDGWKILSTTPEGSAAQMGMKQGDVIRSIAFKRNSMATSSIPLAYGEAIATMPDVSRFTVARDGKTIEMEAKIVTGKVPQSRVEIDPAASALARTIRKEMLGL